MRSSAHWFQPITKEVGGNLETGTKAETMRNTTHRLTLLVLLACPGMDWVLRHHRLAIQKLLHRHGHRSTSSGQILSRGPPFWETLGLCQVDTWCFFSSGECSCSSLEHSSGVFSSYRAKLKSALCCVGHLFRFSG